jgi:NTE family protein
VTNVPTAAIDEFALGGFQQLSGYKLGQFSGNYIGLARLGYYRRLSTSPALARALFVGGTAEAGNAWATASDLKSGRLKTGYSLYVGGDTGMGPVYLSLVHAPQGRTGLYVFIGQP